MSIRRFNESQKLPPKSGWYWVSLGGYIGGSKWIPCWYDGECFLPAGLGDSSSNGLYEGDIEKLGPEIKEPI